MRKALFIIILLIFLPSVLRADTLYLRDGSVLQGNFLGYDNGKFIFQITGSSERNGQTLEFPASQVSRLVLDRNQSSNRTEPPLDRNPSGNRTPLPDRNPGSNRDGAPRLIRGGGAFDSYPAFEVALKDEWTRSEIEVIRGQRFKIEASGQILLDGRTPSSPDGLSNRDQAAPSPNDPDGALIVAIGQGDSPAMLVGRSHEFTADRDGILFFTVNHGSTSNARGSYQVRVSLERLGSDSSNTTESNTSRNVTIAPIQVTHERTFTIFANRAWTDTGIEVEPGMTLEVVASGVIDLGGNRRVDPTGDPYRRGTSLRLPMPGGRPGALLARIHYRQGGASNILVVGTSNSLQADRGEYGRLWLGINDDSFGDNSGAFTVRIRW